MDLNEYIKKQLSKGISVILLGYSFGKSQKILNMLENFPRILLDKNIANATKILENNGISFPKWGPYGNYKKNQLIGLNDYVLIIPPYSIYREPYKSLIAAGANIISLSGKVLDDIYRKEIKADYYIPFSDHCDFKDLCNFIKRCNPDNIYLEHGKICEFSYFLSKSINFSNLKILKEFS